MSFRCLNEYNIKSNELDQIVKWIKGMPKSDKINYKNILSINAGTGELDLYIFKLIPNIEKYNLIESSYDLYKKCIDKVFGNYKYQVSNCNLDDFTPDPYIIYDLIIFPNGINNINIFKDNINKFFKVLNKNGKIWIFTPTNKGIYEIQEQFKNTEKFTIDTDLINILNNSSYKIFRTHIPAQINIQEISKNIIDKILNKDCNINDINKIKDFLKKYDKYMDQPISVIIISNK